LVKEVAGLLKIMAIAKRVKRGGVDGGRKNNLQMT